MSHFTLMVAVPGDVKDVEDYLNALMVRWDENRAVPEYKTYLSDPAEQNYLIPVLKAKGHLGADVESPTWRELFLAKKKHFFEDPTYYGGDFDWHWDDELGAVYELETYNPESKWDWWQIGGRWTGYFPVIPGSWADPDKDKLIVGSPGAFGNARTPGYVDGGPRRLLDLERLRAEKEAAAVARWDAFQEALAGYDGPRLGWSHYREKIGSTTEYGAEYTVDMARADYKSDPLRKHLHEHPDFGWRSWECPTDEFSGSREGYGKMARDAAVPTYAFVGLDKEWRAPGEMGWFGVSSDDEGNRLLFREKMNEEIDNMDPNTILIVLDLHI